ncbi:MULTISPECIES: SEC-C metal-binding domain-containing protein [Myroides]|uniref:SEC-C metal-binding domain-containing protein n=1 Tax=Myroides TaxID=76831 RepID=UPI0008F556A2|nr:MULTISPECIES: SEC-C metal-binding domain-containing protein [Myroides]APA92629.1 hypothetical protein BK054_10440 [Myroides sp. ZB35]MDM1444467.1 SEC-C domain-containing protein [Myroides odoratimimus]MDM1678000.1 SEC-C domain-containing protein [Myroides odoratimimus]MEC4076171.1 SEC-C metal-binding domain-containing protein [Myroides odoratimimus]
MSLVYVKFKEETICAIENFPGLKLYSREDSLPFLEGRINLFDDHQQVYDNYTIRIECNIDYPKSFPLVYETKGRLPYNVDWHLYHDGHFCLCTPIEEYIYCGKGYTLTDFIQNHIIPFLHHQSFREKEGYFLQERSHGLQGILESLYDLFDTKDLNVILNLMIYIYNNDAPLRTAKCFCGSGKKYRICHKTIYQLIKSMGEDRMQQIIEMLNKVKYKY